MKETIPSVLTLTTLVFAVLLGACGGEEPGVPDEEAGVPVTLREVRWTEMPETYRYSGTVQGARSVRLGTKMTGRITYLRVQEGDRVRRGQTLVRIQSDDVAAQQERVGANLLEAQATMANAETNHRRMQALYDVESATRKELDDATTNYEIAQARIDAVNARLNEVQDVLGYAVLTSPIDGFVVRKSANEGDIASPAMPLLVIEQTRILEVVARVPESDIERFSTNDTVKIEVDALGDRTATGVVTKINPSGHAATRQFEIRVAVQPDSQTEEMKPGMFARVVLQKGTRSVIAVPAGVLVRRGQLTGLFTVNDQRRALLRWVRTGKKFDDRVEILSGLAEGEIYVATHTGRLTDGRTVKISN